MSNVPADADETLRLEALLVEFDLHWSPYRLEAAFKEMAQEPLRVRALREMVKIDFERLWRSGQPVSLGDYCERYPELLANGLPPPDLVAAVEEIQRESAETSPPAVLATPLRSGSVHLPKEFGRYRIVRPLGRGGMGGVYLAKDRELDRLVALKVPRFESNDAELFERFAREARAAAAIDHPGICRIYDVGRIDGLPYLTINYVEGPTLVDELKKGPVPVRDAVAWVRDVARAMAEAHRLGVIHRDLKPANILLALPERRPVVTDFGVARREAGSDARLTGEGVVVGTPMYMSPEQISGDRVGPASDVYSLGVVLYELLTGRPPFDGSRTEIFSGTMGKPPEPALTFRPEVDAPLNALVMRALQKKVADRWPSMDAFADEMTRWQNSAASPTPGRWPRWPYTLMLLACVGLGAAAAIGWGSRGPNGIEETRPNASEPNGPILEYEQSLEGEGNEIGAISLAEGDTIQVALRRKDGLYSPRRYTASTGAPLAALAGIEAGQWIAYSRGGGSILVRPAFASVVQYRGNATGRLLYTYRCGPTSTGIWSQTGRFVAFGLLTPEPRAAVFEARSVVNLDQYRGHQSEIRVLALSDDEQFVYSASADAHCLREIKSGRVDREAGQNQVRCAAFLKSRATVAIGHETGEIVLLNALSGRELAARHRDAVLSLSVGRDGQLLVSGSKDGTVIGWSQASGTKLWELKNLAGPVAALDISPDGSRLAVAAGATWQVWRLPRNDEAP